jgi:hypothetical protein
MDLHSRAALDAEFLCHQGGCAQTMRQTIKADIFHHALKD